MTLRKQAVLVLLLATTSAAADRHVVIVEGLGGEPTYTDAFARDVARIADASATVADPANVDTLKAATRDDVLEALARLAPVDAGVSELTLYLIGHGSYDDIEYRFNLVGPDLTGNDLVDALGAQSASTVVVVSTGSSSGQLKEVLDDDTRVLLLATRSGKERHATRFGGYFAEALSTSAADIDKNGIVTATEAFHFAERGVTDYYERNLNLATEHAVLIGERADRFALARLDRRQATETISDSVLDQLIAERDALNDEIETLRLARDSMDAAEYRRQLLERTLNLARAEDAIEGREEELRAN